MKPTVGFMLPSAGVTPAPSTNRKMARTPFCSQVLFLCDSNPGSYLPIPTELLATASPAAEKIPQLVRTGTKSRIFSEYWVQGSPLPGARGEEPRVLLSVVRRFFRNKHVMHVTLAHARVAHLDELRPLAQLREIRRADVSHARLQPADEQLDIRRERPAMGHAPLDSLRHMLAVGDGQLSVAIAGALVHRAERSHPAIKFVGAPLVENRLAGTFLGAREQRSNHHAVRAGRNRLGDIAREPDSAVCDHRDIARLGNRNRVHDSRDLRHPDSRDHTRRANRSRPHPDTQ